MDMVPQASLPQPRSTYQNPGSSAYQSTHSVFCHIPQGKDSSETVFLCFGCFLPLVAAGRGSNLAQIQRCFPSSSPVHMCVLGAALQRRLRKMFFGGNPSLCMPVANSPAWQSVQPCRRSQVRLLWAVACASPVAVV